MRDQPKVADGASELLQDVFGKDKNRPTTQPHMWVARFTSARRERFTHFRRRVGGAIVTLLAWAQNSRTFCCHGPISRPRAHIQCCPRQPWRFPYCHHVQNKLETRSVWPLKYFFMIRRCQEEQIPWVLLIFDLGFQIRIDWAFGVGRSPRRSPVHGGGGLGVFRSSVAVLCANLCSARRHGRCALHRALCLTTATGSAITLQLADKRSRAYVR
jgi:hypothetical protein